MPRPVVGLQFRRSDGIHRRPNVVRVEDDVGDADRTAEVYPPPATGGIRCRRSGRVTPVNRFVRSEEHAVITAPLGGRSSGSSDVLPRVGPCLKLNNLKDTRRRAGFEFDFEFSNVEAWWCLGVGGLRC